MSSLEQLSPKPSSNVSSGLNISSCLLFDIGMCAAHHNAEPCVGAGGQYDCGTTDVTRTMHMGSPSDHQRLCFTRVLQVTSYVELAVSLSYERARSDAMHEAMGLRPSSNGPCSVPPLGRLLDAFRT